MPVLEVRDLNVLYGRSHALQGVDLTLPRGVLAVVGRNGMGKTTLCKAIMGLVPVASGSVAFGGRALANRPSAAIARLGIGYVPQGRRLWRSLTVDEHLRLVGGGRDGAWTIDRIYATFPRLAERRGNGGGQLSGGEQQMLAIGRALLLNPRLLVMDEPTEGLAPVIVAQVEAMLAELGQGGMDALVIEQNIGVATAVAERVAIMVNGRIHRVMDAGELAGDRDLQQRLLGVGRHGHEGTDAGEAGGEPSGPPGGPAATRRASPGLRKVYLSNPLPPTRWSPPVPVARIETAARIVSTVGEPPGAPGAANVPLRPLTRGGESVVLVAGTFDTKGAELRYLRDILRAEGVATRLVDLSTGGAPSSAETPPHQVAAYHPRGASGVMTGDRGRSVAAMTLAFERWIRAQGGIAGIVGAGGSGGTAMLAPAMRALPVGVPKVLVSTIAAGQMRGILGASDILLLPAVADIQGLNGITRAVLGNAAHALAGMVKGRAAAALAGAARPSPDLPAVGLTMFGVTTPCVRQVSEALAGERDCLVFHATGVGGQALERLVEGGMLEGVIDVTTTEVADLLMGGIYPADEDRLGAVIRARMPYVGACGALDMVNFGPPETVPERYRGRLLYEHNPQTTLMRTNAEENARMGAWLGERLNRMEAPVRFFLPEGGVSLLDAPGQPFHDPAADRALFEALERTVRATGNRQLVRLPHGINEPAVAAALTAAFRSLHGGRPVRRAAGR